MPAQNKATLLATDQNQSILAQVSPIDISQMAYGVYDHLSAEQQPSPPGFQRGTSGKEDWPGATGQERRRQEILQHQQREQELRELEAELARVRALEARHIRRHTRPPLQRQLGNMET